jgi:hypothetical protein
MLLQIIQNTPRWVFALFFALLWLGLRQTLSRQMSLQRVLLPALALTALSVYGLMSAWPSSTVVLLCWLKATLTVVWLVRRQPLPDGASYDPDLKRFTVPDQVRGGRIPGHAGQLGTRNGICYRLRPGLWPLQRPAAGPGLASMRPGLANRARCQPLGPEQQRRLILTATSSLSNSIRTNTGYKRMNAHD